MGLGARVSLSDQAQDVAARRIRTDGSYLSASDARVHFGLGAASMARTVRVEWLGGTAEEWKNVPANRLTTLRQGTGQPVSK